ncbi:Sulfate transporter 1.1 [Quillaja saponaria]|uniref:Sulfate transporter 1.1 n=1 Tax=Quillaja saponaria TaxID=32244 RepID=A0AAD7LGW3_QUISA|nr:Sulfate transporter 1.1 [Quillaja saponaria]
MLRSHQVYAVRWWTTSKTPFYLMGTNFISHPTPKRVFSFLQEFLPILICFQNYNARNFKYELMVGLTLASLSIPQSMGSMGYATLVNQDPQYRLYWDFWWIFSTMLQLLASWKAQPLSFVFNK